MPRDPIDDLLATPDGTVNPFDPLEAAVSQAVAQSVFQARRVTSSESTIRGR